MTKNDIRNEAEKEIIKFEVKHSNGIYAINLTAILQNKNDEVANYNLEISNEEIKSYEDIKASDVAKTADIKGFRKGKVPVSYIKSKYEASIKKEALEEIIDKSIRKLFEHKKLKAAVDPKIEIQPATEDKFLFSIEVELYPEIIIPEFSTIKVETPIFEITQEDVNKALEEIGKANRDFSEVDHESKAKLDDKVIIDYVGKIDGKEFEGGAAKDHSLVLGSKNFIDNFEEQLVGSKKNDQVIVKVTFPEEYHAKDLAGKKAEFTVTVKEVLASTAQTNDSLAVKLGFENFVQFEEKLKEQLAKDHKKIADTKTRKDLFDQLCDKCEFIAPKTMAKSEFDIIWAEAQKNNEFDSEKSEEENKVEYQKLAERRVKLGMLVAELGKINQVKIENSELEKAVLERARMYPGYERQVFEFYQKNPNAIQELKGPILEDKVVSKILESVSKTEKKYSLTEIRELLI